MILASLGFCPFTLKTLPLNEFSLSTKSNIAYNNRINKLPDYQFMGIKGKQLNLNCILCKEISKMHASIHGLKLMQKNGNSWLLMVGRKLYGFYIIESIKEKHKHLNQYGEPIKIELSLSLREVEPDFDNSIYKKVEEINNTIISML